MRLPGQSNKPDIPGYTNNTLISSICKHYSIIQKEKGGLAPPNLVLN
jgi:hypothetical protein